jgi:hypothetical protein
MNLWAVMVKNDSSCANRLRVEWMVESVGEIEMQGGRAISI